MSEGENVNLRPKPPLNFYNPHRHPEREKIKLWPTLVFYIKYADSILNDNINGVAGSFDTVIVRSDFPFFLKRILHLKQLMLIMYIINNHILLVNLSSGFIFYTLTTTLILMLTSIAVMVTHNIFDYQLYLDEDPELENYALKINKEIEKNRCENCGVIKCIRTVHCEYCRKCVKKFNFHSDWFNMCIGCSNEIIYAIAMSFTLLYMICSYLILLYDIIFDSSSYLIQLKFQFHLWGIICSYCVVKSVLFYYKFVKLLLKNVTIYESMTFFRLTYMIKDFRKEFFNPFNKGRLGNLKEAVYNFRYGLFRKKPKKELNGSVPVSTEDNEREQNIPPQGNNWGYDADSQAYSMFLKLAEDRPPFISALGNEFKKVNGELDTINWCTLRIYSVFDIENSPFSQKMIAEAKKKKEMMEKMMQAQQNQTEATKEINKEQEKANEEPENSEEEEEEKEEKEENQ